MGQLLFGELDHPADHVPADGTVLTRGDVSPVAVGWYLNTQFLSHFILELV